jgi:hypothetical protein
LNIDGADEDAVWGGPGNWTGPPPPPVGAYVPCGICAYCTFLRLSDFLKAFGVAGPYSKQINKTNY